MNKYIPCKVVNGVFKCWNELWLESADTICGKFDSIKVTRTFVSIKEVIYTHGSFYRKFVHVLV